MNNVKKILELRAEIVNLKELEEQRADLVVEMDTILNKAKEEKRAMSTEEDTRFNTIKDQIDAIDKTIKAAEERAALEEKKPVKKSEKEKSYEERANDELRAIFEGRAAAMNTATNSEGGYVVNSELVKEIIKELKDRSDVYNFFNGTTIKGDTRIPKKTSQGIAKWMDENSSSEPESSVPTLVLVELGQHRLYRESAITQQMLNSQEIDLKSFIIDDISESMVDAIEEGIFNGTGTKQPTGVIAGIKPEKKINLEVRGKIDFDHLKRCKAKIKKSGWKKAKWFMHADTLLEVDLLKDADGRPLLQPDLTAETGYKILGIPVEVTDAMSSPADVGAKCLVVLATPNAYHTNTQKSVALYVYTDSAFTRKGLVGFGSDIYMDGKTKNDDQLAGIFNIA